MTKWKLLGIVLSAAGSVLWESLKASAMALVVMCRTVPDEIDSIATIWRAQVMQQKAPNGWDRSLYWSFIVLAWITFVAGWIIVAHIITLFTRFLF